MTDTHRAHRAAIRNQHEAHLFPTVADFHEEPTPLVQGRNTIRIAPALNFGEDQIGEDRSILEAPFEAMEAG